MPGLNSFLKHYYPKHRQRVIAISLCVCPFLRNPGDSFVLLLAEPIARKNTSPSDKQL